MRRRWVIVLTGAAFLAHLSVVHATPAESLVPTHSIPVLATNVTYVRTNRRLRTNDDDANKNDERGIDAAAVEKVSNTLKSAVTNDQLEAWLKKGETADDVFKLLTLDKAADDILTNPHLNSWVDYVKKFNKKNPTKKTSLTATLAAHYGDDGVAKLIEAAKKMPGASSIAKRLEADRFHDWMLKGKKPGDVFDLLKLDDAGESLFTNPQFRPWVNYLDDFNGANPKKQETIFSVLGTRYDDDDLVPMLLAAKNDPRTKNLAIRMQAEQTKFWLKSETEPSDVFKFMRLDDMGLGVISHPLFKAWAKYTEEFRKVNYGTKLTTMAALRELYTDDALVMMILAAYKYPSTATLAARLDIEMIRTWYISKIPPEKIFMQLKLDRAGDAVFEKLLFKYWMKYMDYYSNTKPKGSGDLVTTLTRLYGDAKLSRIIHVEKGVASTKTFAMELQAAQLTRWLSLKTHPDDVFDFLHVKGTAAKDVRRRLYNTYVELFENLTKRRKTNDAVAIPTFGNFDNVLDDVNLGIGNTGTRKRKRTDR